MSIIIQFPVFGASREGRSIGREASKLPQVPNHDLYSAFLLKNGRRPNAQQAAILGKLLGKSVKAANGKLYPPRRTEKNSTKSTEIQDQMLVWDDILRLKEAIRLLSEIKSIPAQLFVEIDQEEGGEISESLVRSLKWLSSFSKGWIGNGHRTPKKTSHRASDPDRR